MLRMRLIKMSETKWPEAVAVVVTMLFNLVVLVGATYLVAEREWSMWTYLLALCFMFNVKTGKAAEKNE